MPTLEARHLRVVQPHGRQQRAEVLVRRPAGAADHQRRAVRAQLRPRARPPPRAQRHLLGCGPGSAPGRAPGRAVAGCWQGCLRRQKQEVRWARHEEPRADRPVLWSAAPPWLRLQQRRCWMRARLPAARNAGSEVGTTWAPMGHDKGTAAAAGGPPQLHEGAAASIARPPEPRPTQRSCCLQVWLPAACSVTRSFFACGGSETQEVRVRTWKRTR